MKQSDDPNAAARAERLAAALRENLKKRKVQAKGRVAAPSHAGPVAEGTRKGDEEARVDRPGMQSSRRRVHWHGRVARPR